MKYFDPNPNHKLSRAMANGSPNNFSSALATWRGIIRSIHDTNYLMVNGVLLDISLAELQKTLDAQGIEIVDNQKESMLGRKALAEKTKGMLVVSYS